MDLDWEHENPVPVVTYDDGTGKQSKLLRDWTLIPWDAMALVVQVLEGARVKYGKENWKTIPAIEHIQHLLEHSIASYQCSDDQLLTIEHLTHVVCRALFALQIVYEDYHETRETVYTVRNPDASDGNGYIGDDCSHLRQDIRYAERNPGTRGQG